MAQEKFKLPNLAFVVGDAAEPLFADDPLDGILSSSTLHHVYTFNGYSRNHKPRPHRRNRAARPVSSDSPPGRRGTGFAFSFRRLRQWEK